MAATDMRSAGLEIGCKVEVHGLQDPGEAEVVQTGVVVKITDALGKETILGDAIKVKMDDGQPAGGKTIGRNRSDCVRDFDDAQKARQGRIEQLLGFYPGEGTPEITDTVERYCGVQKNKLHGIEHDPARAGWHHYYGDDFESVARSLAEDMFEDWWPEAIWDLDTGERIDLHIGSPIITISEDRNALVNPLDPEEWADLERRYGGSQGATNVIRS